MKKKINDLLNGNIRYERQKPELSHEILEGKVGVQDIYRGTFFLNAPAKEQVKGYVHCTNARIGFRPDSFSGFHESFVFEADTKGLIPGDRITGEFILSTSHGELRLPIDIAVEAMGLKESEPALSKEDFLQLAKEHFSEAYAMFLSKDFQKQLINWGQHYVNLYRGIREQQVTYMSLEQFLVGAGLKEPVKFMIEDDKLTFGDVEESQKECIKLQKENWGFSVFAFKSDADFIRMLQPKISTEEFAGSNYEIQFLIDQNALHEGRNYARVTINSGYEEKTVEIVVDNNQRFLDDNDIHRQRLEITQMISVYLDYQTGKIGEADWIGITQNTIDNYHKMGGEHIFFKLYETYLAIRQKQTEKALQMISAISEKKEYLKAPEMYGIYLVLTRFLNPNVNYQDWVKEHLQTLYLENQENWIIQWLMIKVNSETIRNETEKLDLIRRQFQSGCSSPIMYLEAYKILKAEPLMLRKLESFEIHLLQFICRERVLDREISGQVAQIAARMQKFEPLLFRVLCKCFEVYPTKNMLTAICSLLIAGKKRTSEYANWYALGIKQDVRITGLYEYFVETTEDFNDKMLPASVKMYFIYHNTLGYVKKAAIYANIVKNKQNDPDTYDEYRSSMERFTEEQVERGHINQDLAVLYEDLLEGELFTPALAAGLEKILFMYEITCNSSNIKKVLVYHGETTLEQRVNLNEGKGFIQLLSPDAVIILEDINGNRYPVSDDVKIQRMINKKELEDACRAHLDKKRDILVYDCCKDGSRIDIEESNVSNYLQLLQVPYLKANYAKEIRSALIDYYKQHTELDSVERFIIEEKSREMILEKLTDWLEILAARGHFDQVMDLTRVYGMEKVSPEVLLRMCHFCILDQDYNYDKMLLAICEYCLGKQKYDEVMLKYMMMHYEGGLKEMKTVWEKGTEYGLESMEMEERILGTLLLTEDELEETEVIFESYSNRPGKTTVIRTYAILMAYRFFVREKQVEKPVFTYLEASSKDRTLPDVCRLALMKHLALQDELDQMQELLLENLCKECLNQGMRFSFFMDLPEKIQKKLNLYDKYIIEYRTRPQQDVMLHYVLNEDKEEVQIMQEVFDGIYTKEFTLFYDDRMEYYCQPRSVSETPEKVQIIFRKDGILDGFTRYELINRMISASKSKEEEQYQKLKKQYIRQQYLVDTLFPIH